MRVAHTQVPEPTTRCKRQLLSKSQTLLNLNIITRTHKNSDVATMSSRTLRQCMLRTNKIGSRGPALASPLRASLNLRLTSASSPSTLNRCGTGHLQSREFCITLSAVTSIQANLVVSPQGLFHNTPVRRLYVSDTIIAGCLGVAGGVMLMSWLPRYLLSKRGRQTIPPVSWMIACDKKRLLDVAGMVSTAFEMARKAPIRRRDQALREAAFHVPHEVARINSGAGPRFRVEDMGPMPSLPKDLQAHNFIKAKYPLDIRREARAFLYFSHDSTRATAAIVAINAELRHIRRSKDTMVEVAEASDDHKALVQVAMDGWSLRYKIWRDREPHILDRIEPGKLPVIFCFREKVSGCLFNPKTEGFDDLMSVFLVTSLGEPQK